MAGSMWRKTDSSWERIKSAWRKTDSSWERIRSAWRKTDGSWELVFGGIGVPIPKSGFSPLLYIVNLNGTETTSLDINAAILSNQTSPTAYDGDKIYLTRGRWTQEPLSFFMRIQKSQDPGFDSGITLANTASSATKTYLEYSDSNYEDQVPLSSANRHTITIDEVRDGYYFRGKVEATNSDDLTGIYATDLVLPRIYADVNFNQNLDNSYGTSIQTNGGTFTWSYIGNSTIQAQDISEQQFLVYPLNNTSGNALYSTTIFPGTGTSAPTTTVTFTSANLSPNTQFTVVIKTTMQDGWASNSTIALRTIISDQVNFTTAAAKPLAPTNVTGTDVGTNRPFNNGAVSLSWSQSSNGVSIVGYKIEYSVGPDYLVYSVLVSNTGNSSTSGTFTGLDSNKNYKFVITAIGAEQNSDPSADSNAVLITTVPREPTGISAVAGNALANVSFTASNFTGGKTVTDFRATSNPDNLTDFNNFSPIEVTGLTNYTSYTFTVAARNANGYSIESVASSAVTPTMPAPVGSGTVTIASNSASNYIYQITSYGTWSNSATTYDYEWQTSADGGSTWTTRASSTNVATIPNYDASAYKAQNIRLRVYGRNQTGAAIIPLVSNTLFIFYTTPIINSFTVTGNELFASYTYSITADDPARTIELEYKLSSSSEWSSIVSPPSSGNISLSAGTYDFRLFVTNSTNGGFRIASATQNNIVVSSIYTFSFNNVIYPNTNGMIALTAAAASTGFNIPSSGKVLIVFGKDLQAATGHRWSGGGGTSGQDSNKYVYKYDGYQFGFFGQSAYRIEYMVTFYTDQTYIDVKIITRGASVTQPTIQAGLYKDGVLVSSAGTPTLAANTTFRVNLASPGGSTGISYDEILNSAPNNIMLAMPALSVGDSDQGYWNLTAGSSQYNTPTVSFGTASNTTTSISVPFTESGGTDYITYNIRTGSYSGTVVDSGTDFTSPLFSNFGISASTTYYITATPYNYKNQVGTTAQTTTTTPAPTPTASGFTRSDATVQPSQPSTITFSSSNNNVTSFWTNGSPITSVTFDGTGLGNDSLFTDNSSPFIEQYTEDYASSGTYTATVTNINNSLQVNVSWNQSNTQSYKIHYTSSVFGADETGIFNDSGSSASRTLSWGANQGSFTFTAVTLYSETNGTGTSNFINTGLSAITPSQKTSSRQNSVALTYVSPVLAPTNATIPTLSPTSLSVGTQLSAGIGTWNNSPTNYDIRIYRGTQNVITSETLVASRNNSSTANLTYTITQADYNSGQRYFRTFVNASNSGGSSGFIAGQERGPIAAPVSIPSGGSVTLTGNNTAGSTITASTSGWSGSPTSYDVFITTALSPNIPTSSSSRVASSNGATSTSYTITSFDTVSPVNIFRAFATASNSAGTSGIVQSSNTITAASATPATAPGTPGTPTNGWTGGTSYPFSWAAPSAGTVSGGGAATITNYSIRIYEAGNSAGTGAVLLTTFNTGSGSSSYTYTSPNASLYYAASVAAINSAGLQGPYSGISQYK
jgi:hypothetical protein